MEELFRKYCVFYTSNGTNEEFSILNEEAGEAAKLYQKKALKFIRNLRQRVNKLGYGIDFESFCNLLEEYIAKKSELEDKDKKIYLKILFSLSKIYDVNLREELEKYVSYKKVSNRQLTERDVFIAFCLYTLNPNDDVSEFNRLSNICEINKLNFNDIHRNSVIFVEEIKYLTEKLGFGTSIDDIYKMVDKYNKEKKNMNDQEKTNYLKILLYLCEIYNINLRELIIKDNSSTNNKKEFYQNPLDNKELLLELIKRRFELGSFHIEKLNNNEEQIEDKAYDYYKELSYIIFNVYQIFIDKYNNYAFDDLNPIYSNLLIEEDVICLESLEPENIENILIDINNHEKIETICAKYNLPENVYKFIYKSIYETLDLNTKSIGVTSLFNIKHTTNNIAIYLNGPDTTMIEIIKRYIIKCIDQNIGYELDGLCYDNETYRTVIYSNKKDFKQKISILENIIINNNLKKDITISLPFSCHDNELYSVSRRYIFNDEVENNYIDYTNGILELAYYRTIAKLIISQIRNKKEQDIVNTFINLKNISCPDLHPLNTSFDNISFLKVKDTINNYIPLVNKSITKYITEKEYQKDIIIEFEKAILYISNLIEGKEKHLKRNIAISN